ncbi:MAG: hypothetical protein GF400_04835 [Candidatus Eisenbacteria bacterium]|nr:hypothetical protein [Candidatus Eisenbacteria bacterium]
MTMYQHAPVRSSQFPISTTGTRHGSEAEDRRFCDCASRPDGLVAHPVDTGRERCTMLPTGSNHASLERSPNVARPTRKSAVALLLVAASLAVVALLYSLTKILPSAHIAPKDLEIGILTEHTSRDLDTHFSRLVQRLDERNQVRELSLADLVPPDSLATGRTLDELDVLLVLGSGHVADSNLYEIDQFLLRGGRAAFCLDGARLSSDRSESEIQRGNLFAFVSFYGATSEPDLVVDTENASTGHPESEGLYPFWPIGSEAANEASRRVMPGDRDVVFTWTSSVTSEADSIPGVTARALARSSAAAWSTTTFSDVRPDAAPEPASGLPGEVPRQRVGERPLAVAIEGSLESAFRGMPVIVEEEDGTVKLTRPTDRLSLGVATRVVVVGTSTMFEDSTLKVAPANLEFLTNIVGWLGQG